MTPPEFLILFAAAAQAAIMFYAIATLGIARVSHVMSGALTMKDIALSDALWPDDIKKLQNNARNQFETPVLFFAGIAITLAIGAASWGVAIFAWAFIACRVVHRMIHVGSNNVRKRFSAYFAGFLSLIGLWIAVLISTTF